MPPRKRAAAAEKAAAGPVAAAIPAAADAPPAKERVTIDYQRLSKVTKVLRLEGIDTIEMSFLTLLDPRHIPDVPRESETGYSNGIVDARWFRNQQQLDVVLGYRIIAHLRTPEVAGHRDLFTLTARFLISYVLPEGFEVGEAENDVMADLVMANGQINSFPYFRQLVVEQTSRGGWPPLTLDVLRAPATRVVNIVRNASAFGTHAA